MLAVTKKQSRIEIRADKDWVDAVAAEAERWQLSVAGYIRLAVAEKMERDHRGDSRPDTPTPPVGGR